MDVKKIWKFIWYDNSWQSWVVNVILAFVLVKFIIYPLLGLLLGTSFPVVAVVSCSMEHNINSQGCNFEHLKFDDWWSLHKEFYTAMEITKENFSKFDFSNGFNKGDLMVLRKAKNINNGDIIIFFGEDNLPIIHRVVDSNKLTTKGDNNLGIRSDEFGINDDRLIGKAWFRVPYLGWLKVWFNQIFLVLFSV